MPLVTPTPIPAYPAAPLVTDDRVTFSAKAFALASAYEPQRASFNLAATQTNMNAAYAHERANASAASADAASGSATTASQKANEANTAVVDVRAALAAIQSGPVASVMGRTGVVTGLVEAAATLQAGINLDTVLTSGFYLLPAGFNLGGTDTNYRYDIDNGQMIVSRAGSTVYQQISSSASRTTIFRNGWNNGGLWEPWQRMLGDLTVIERLKYVSTIPSNVYTLDPSEGSIHYLDIRAATTINVLAPRKHGDQFTLIMNSVGGAWPVVFSSNVRAPASGIPALTAGRITTMTALGIRPTWYLYPGMQHAA